MAAVSGGAGGELNVNTRKLGGKDLAENVRIFRSEDGTLKPVALSDLNGITPASEVAYGHTDWADRVDVVVIGGSKSGEVVYYGRAIFRGGLSEENQSEWQGQTESNTVYYNELSVEYGNGERTKAYRTSNTVRNGAYIRMTVSGDRVVDVRELTELRNVPNSAWSGPGAVTVGGRTYTVDGDVACYDATTNSWISLDTAHAYAETSTLYVYDGMVRIVENEH